MMITLSGCQTSAKTGGFISYDEHYQKNETTLKEDALSDRWESRGSKVAVVSKEKADNNDYPEAKEVLLVNNTKNKVIVSQKVFDQAYPASTTKIMTALLTLENLNLSQVVTIKHDITFPDGAAVAIHLKKGDKITVEALLNALIIMSANDAAVALGEAVAGSEANFVKMMNKRAKELGATNTHFANPNGLHLSDHYSTAYDLYLIFKEVAKHNEFFNIAGRSSSRIEYLGSKGEQKIYDILDSSIKLYSCVLEDELNEEDLDKVIYELVKRKVFNDVIDNIIVLEEIEYLQIYNITEKLKFIYYYLLELEIYNYYSIERIKWKNEKQKQYVSNKVKYSSLLQNKIKQDFIDNGSLSKKDMYLYNKTIGIISTYPIKEIINKYNDRILTDVYRIKYLLTLESKLQKCSDNKVLEKKNETIVIEHKSFFKELLDKYKKLIEKKDSSIRKLEKENNVLKKENDIKQNTIINYANCINEYNNLSWIKKLSKIFKKDNIKLLN